MPSTHPHCPSSPPDPAIFLPTTVPIRRHNPGSILHTVLTYLSLTPEVRATLARLIERHPHRQPYSRAYEESLIVTRGHHPRTPTHRGVPA